MMEWEKHQQQRQEEEEVMNGNCSGGSNGMFVKVMTDDQMETLRKQIAAYATICEQLVQMHKSFTSHPDPPGGGGGGARLGNFYCDPLMTSAGHRITGRQRWTPTPMQLQILERIFEKGNGTPSKQKIKDITGELSQHGQISETNVYNWFQNRRARSKRKQQLPNNNNTTESEVETEVESSSSPSPNEKRAKTGDDFHPHNTGNHEDNVNNNMYLQNLEMMHSTSLDHSQESIRREMMMIMKAPSSSADAAAASSKLSMSYYDTMLSNPRMDQLMGKIELSGDGGYNPYLQTDDYSMTN